MDERPQTNLQLLNQLRRDGYPDGDVAQIKAVYDYVACQFSGWFRASGKPFLAHLVGTAGILVGVRARTAVIAAGLSHAVYEQGELVAGGPSLTRAMRAEVRRALGAEAEDRVARYAMLEWNVRALAALRERLPALAPADREVVLIRLANELDDHLDLGALYCGNAEHRRGRIGAGLRLAGDLARDLGVPELGASLDRAFDATLSTELPGALRTDRATSFSVSPAPTWLRASAWLRHVVAGLARKGVGPRGGSG